MGPVSKASKHVKIIYSVCVSLINSPPLQRAITTHCTKNHTTLFFFFFLITLLIPRSAPREQPLQTLPPEITDRRHFCLVTVKILKIAEVTLRAAGPPTVEKEKQGLTRRNHHAEFSNHPEFPWQANTHPRGLVDELLLYISHGFML